MSTRHHSEANVLKVTVKNSSESKKRTQSTVSPNCAANAPRSLSGMSRISPKKNSHLRSKKGTEKAADPVDGGRDTETTIPVSCVRLSIKPSTLMREPAGVSNNVQTGMRSENSLLSKSQPSSKEMMLSFIEKEWGTGHARLFALMVGLPYLPSPQSGS